MTQISNHPSQKRRQYAASKTVLSSAMTLALAIMSSPSWAACDQAELDRCYERCGIDKHGDDNRCREALGDHLAYCRYAYPGNVDPCVEDAKAIYNACLGEACDKETWCRAACEENDAFYCTSSW